LAAKELQSQKWIYHPQLHTWFLRSDAKSGENEVITSSYFETEEAWEVKKKDFRFDRKVFENMDL
jgi:CCR4-NOT transcriptional regulation complex NOT5 subunit